MRLPAHFGTPRTCFVRPFRHTLHMFRDPKGSPTEGLNNGEPEARIWGKYQAGASSESELRESLRLEPFPYGARTSCF